MQTSISGYQREDGRLGIRNHVLVLPLHLAACAAAQRIAAEVEGVVTVRHDWARRGTPDDVARAGRIFAGFAAHPNVAATLCVGLDDDDMPLAETAARRRTGVEFLSLAGCGGTARTVERGTQVVRALMSDARGLSREPASLSALCLGLECGGSDALSGITANPALGVASDMLVQAGGTSILAETSELIGAEHLLAARAVSPQVADDLYAIIDRFEQRAAALGVDLRGGQPVPGNIEGGLTTIEEKSLGAAKKGGAAPVSGVLEFAVEPAGPGLQVMDTPGNDIEQMVGMVAAGCQVVAFTTGRGTPTGSPIAPCIKIATNSSLYKRLMGDLDLDTGAILQGLETHASMGEKILATIAAVARGDLTAAERNRNCEFALSRVEPQWGAAVAAP